MIDMAEEEEEDEHLNDLLGIGRHIDLTDFGLWI